MAMDTELGTTVYSTQYKPPLEKRERHCQEVGGSVYSFSQSLYEKLNVIRVSWLPCDEDTQPQTR